SLSRVLVGALRSDLISARRSRPRPSTWRSSYHPPCTRPRPLAPAKTPCSCCCRQAAWRRQAIAEPELPDHAGLALPDHAGPELPDRAELALPDHAGPEPPDAHRPGTAAPGCLDPLPRSSEPASPSPSSPQAGTRTAHRPWV